MRGLFILYIFALPIAAPAGDNVSWPCFHGPNRDNLSADTGLLQTWPEGGPKLLWTASDIGFGYSSVAIVGDRIFTAGMIDKQTYVTALDMTGRQIWQCLNGQSWQASERQTWAVPYAGSRCTPTVDGNMVYHLSELGRLAAFDFQTGEERWHVDLLKAFKADRPEYGYSESPLIHGDVLFCSPAGEIGYIAAMDKKTGHTIWTGPALKDAVGNGSCITAQIDGIEQVLTMSASRVLSFDPKSGRLLWQYPFANKRENNCTDVIVSDDLVYASSGYGKGSVLLRPKRQAGGEFSVESVWTSDLLDNHHGGVLLLDGYLYGAGHEARGWFCLDFLTGRKHWQETGKGSLTYAGGRLYCLEERGTMSLVKATPEKWDVVGSFRPPRDGKGLFWAHPVVCGGRLYIRHAEKLFAYDAR
ncbi:MAG: PQQ-binding-like beta-propeller repeat protein [Sedimentisphaerales bacterium]|nr:PQQ-binding-like beta-propeller repeat protein [Sedimentisphaerales bacterium]